MNTVSDQVLQLENILQRHHIIAAKARELLANGGHFQANLSQLKRVDNILLEIACGPDAASRQIDPRQKAGVA